MSGGFVRFTFGFSRTSKGCEVWRKNPSGIIHYKTFRDSANGLAMEKAKQWVREWRKSIFDDAKERGVRVEFDIPEELTSTTDLRLIVLPLEKWDAFDEAANKAGMGLFKWLEAAGDFYLLATTKKGE